MLMCNFLFNWMAIIKMTVIELLLQNDVYDTGTLLYDTITVYSVPVLVCYELRFNNDG